MSFVPVVAPGNGLRISAFGVVSCDSSHFLPRRRLQRSGGELEECAIAGRGSLMAMQMPVRRVGLTRWTRLTTTPEKIGTMQILLNRADAALNPHSNSPTDSASPRINY